MKGNQKGITMSFEEGSSEVDNGTFPYPGDEGSEGAGYEGNEGSEGEKNEGSHSEGEDGEEGKKKLTDKGTKLDEDPITAAHQLLANERKIRKQYEAVLSNPELLKKYAKEAGITLAEAKEEIKDEQKKQFSPDRFKTREDVATALNEIQEGFTKTITELREENQKLQGKLDGFEGSSRIERVASTMKTDIDSVREKYPELDPKSPDYDQELESEIGSLYHEIDFDEESGSYRGKFSIAKIADRVMKAAGKARKSGSENAKTDIIVKRSGKVVTSGKTTDGEPSESNDPSTSIAQKIARAMKR